MVHDHLPGGPRAKATFLYFKHINTQNGPILAFQFSVVVQDQETTFVSGPQVPKGWKPLAYMLHKKDFLKFIYL